MATLREWIRAHPDEPNTPLFRTQRGTQLSTDAVKSLVAKHAATATACCPSLASKHVTPHVLRHSAAMVLRQAGADISVIALWLGHERIVSTPDLPAISDLAIKEQAFARAAPPGIAPGRYRPPDTLLAFLDHL